MTVLKWYSIILIGFAMLITLINMVKNDDLIERIGSLLAIILFTPLLIYLILS